MQQRDCSFSSGGLRLEGILSLPQGHEPVPGVVVCHPHPLYGGDMQNNVVVAVASALVQAGMAVLRFNFRGVGLSQGEHDKGRGEQQDTLSAVAYLAGQADVLPDSVGLAGYSFGASVALAAASQAPQVRALAAISPPTSRRSSALEALRVPAFFISGDEDEFSASQELAEWAALSPHFSLRIVSGADHFWWQHELELSRQVAQFFQKQFAGKKR